MHRPLALLLLLVSACAPLGAGATRSSEPAHYLFSYFRGNGEDGLHLAHSTDGMVWRPLRGDSSFLAPAVGRERLMRDPSILRATDGTFHMVWTPGWFEQGIGYASSRDLVRWSEQRYLPVMAHEPTALNAWAPELFYDDTTDEYLIFWASTIPGRYPATEGQQVSPEHPTGLNHRMYYVRTRDFETFSDTRLFYEPGFNVIDATIVKAGSRYAMFLKDETNTPFTPQKNIRVAFADRPQGPYGPPSPPITGAYWAEGPTALRVDGRWHVYFDKYIEQRYGVVVSDDLREWTDLSERLSMPAGMRHGTAFEVPASFARRMLAPGAMASGSATAPSPPAGR